MKRSVEDQLRLVCCNVVIVHHLSLTMIPLLNQHSCIVSYKQVTFLMLSISQSLVSPSILSHVAASKRAILGRTYDGQAEPHGSKLGVYADHKIQ